jgi:hypothetical protein
MHRKSLHVFMLFFLIVTFVSLACATSQPTPTSTPEPSPSPSASATVTLTATRTPRPSPTPRPTQTPNLAATQQAEELNAIVQEYFEKGYLATTEGIFRELEDFSFDWAQLHYYKPFPIQDDVGDFFLSAHFKWDSALKNSDISGCGFIFGIQPNDDHYAVFLDRQKVFFLITDNTVGFSRPVSPTRGTGIVKFDYPAEADFTLIVKGAYAYVLVNGEVSAEYTLAQSRSSKGGIGLTVLSGTNKDYGTRCEMSNMHLWLAKD